MTLLDIHAELPGSIRPLRRVEYDRMVELGMFEDEPIELLEGALVEMSPKGAPHAWLIQEINHVLTRGLPGDLRLRVGNPLAVSEWSEPEPDFAVVAVGDYRRAHPSQAVLLIEVSRSSLGKDLGVKARVYAAAGVPEYWVVDVARGVVHLHRHPSPEGYAEVTVHGTDATLDACGVAIPLADLLDGLADHTED